MRYQVQTQTTQRVYDSNRNYNVNDTVTIGNIIYQNITGMQGNPATDTVNWMALNSGGSGSVTYNEISLTSLMGQSVFNLPTGLTIRAVLIGDSTDLPTSKYIYSSTTGELTINAPELNGFGLTGLDQGVLVRVRSF